MTIYIFSVLKIVFSEDFGPDIFVFYEDFGLIAIFIGQLENNDFLSLRIEMICQRYCFINQHELFLRFKKKFGILFWKSKGENVLIQIGYLSNANDQSVIFIVSESDKVIKDCLVFSCFVLNKNGG